MAVGYLTEQNINLARGLIRGTTILSSFDIILYDTPRTIQV